MSQHTITTPQSLETQACNSPKSGKQIPNSQAVVRDKQVEYDTESHFAHCDTNPPTPSNDSQLAELLKDKYEIEEKIGKGAQSNVYRGKRISDQTQVAIKQRRINSAKNWKQYELFDREAEVLKSLDVPGTAKFYEAINFLDDKAPTSVIVQEYIDGRSLQEYIDQQTRFSFNLTCNILIQILDILKNLHQRNPSIIHRDIKPSNIILRYDDDKFSQIPEVFIIDFGAVANPQVKDGGSTVTGTYGYMAPEQLVGHPTTASDIYAFGVLAVYLFSGVPPEKLDSKDLQLLIDPHLEHLPYDVTLFLRQLIDPSPVKRLVDYAIIRQMLSQLEQGNFKLRSNLNHKAPPFDEAAIRKVQALGQKGNIALWQALSDHLPREKIPQTYQDMIRKDRIFWPLQEVNIGYHTYRSYQESVYAENQWFKTQIAFTYKIDIYKKNTKKFQMDSEDIFFKGIPLVMTCLIISLIPPVLLVSFYELSDSFTYLTGVFLSTPVFVILLFLTGLPSYFFSRNWKNPFYSIACENISEIKQKMETFQTNLKQIFIRGRKSLSTVSNIEMIMPEHKIRKVIPVPKVSKNQTVKETIIDQEIQKVILYAKDEHEFQRDNLRPLWKIEYYFNPPDDNSPDPVHHVYYSDVPPVNLKIGDTLPILYMIDHEKDVFSIPYPLPAQGSLVFCPNLMSKFGIRTIA